MARSHSVAVDFACRLPRSEEAALPRSRSQFVISKRGQNSEDAPVVVTEHVVVMAATDRADLDESGYGV